MTDDDTTDPQPDPELAALLGEYGSFLNRYIDDDDSSGATVVDLGVALPSATTSGQPSPLTLKRRRLGASVLAVAASLLAVVGLLNATNLMGSNDGPTSVRGGAELPVFDAPTTGDTEQPDDSTPNDDGTNPVLDDAEPTATPAAGTAPASMTPAVPPTPEPMATPTPSVGQNPAAGAEATAEPTSTPTAVPTAIPTLGPTAPPVAPTPTPAPACASPFELVGTECLAYAPATTSDPTCPVTGVAAGATCRENVAFLPLELQCSGTVQGQTCVTTVAGVQTEACPSGAVTWPLNSTTECGLASPATQGPPTCPFGTAGVAGPVNGGCYLPLGPPDAAGQCPDNGPAVSTVIVDGECRQPVANAQGTFACPTGQQLWGAECLMPVAVVTSVDCPTGSTASGTGCMLTIALTPQCPSGTSVGADGTCFRDVALIPGVLGCTQGVLQNDVCVVTGPPPQ